MIIGFVGAGGEVSLFGFTYVVKMHQDCFIGLGKSLPSSCLLAGSDVDAMARRFMVKV
jgi:hypothetical protein